MFIKFLGNGNSHALDMGNSSAVFNFNNDRLLIDCGFTVPSAYKLEYNVLPSAIFLTHAHLDHIGGLENLFYSSYFSENTRIKIFTHYNLVPVLHKRLASLDNITAEGDANFWDAFQLIPVDENFWYGGFKFHVFENRHHASKSSYGICLKGKFIYTGDTKPIPEIINTLGNGCEKIFHDLSTFVQPSHTYLDEISQYDEHIVERCIFYHLSSQKDIQICKSRNLNTVNTNKKYIL